MSFYHVTITPKEMPTADEIRLDLTSEELVLRIVEPYKRGRKIAINGRTVADIHRIKIHETQEHSESFLPVLREKQAIENATFGHLASSLRLSSFVIEGGADVTDKFITGPFGWATEGGAEAHSEMKPEKNAREVFVVHGRNTAARDALFDFLNAIDLHPLEWSEAVKSTGKASPYVGDVLNVVFSRAHAVVVLFTPDDEARLKKRLQDENDPPHETQLTGQARPNVLFEAGMAMARNQDRTVLVELGRLRPFSDVGGRHVLRLENSTQSRQNLAQRLETAGCPVNLQGTRWHAAGDFDAAIAASVDGESESRVVGNQEMSTEVRLEFSQEMQDLLNEATDGSGSTINRFWRGPRLKLATNNRYFCNSIDHRETTKWHQVIVGLEKVGFIEDTSGEGRVFRVTHAGLKYVDGLRN